MIEAQLVRLEESVQAMERHLDPGGVLPLVAVGGLLLRRFLGLPTEKRFIDLYLRRARRDLLALLVQRAGGVV